MQKTRFPITVRGLEGVLAVEKSYLKKLLFCCKTRKFPVILLHIKFPSVFPLHNLNYTLIVYDVIKKVFKFILNYPSILIRNVKFKDMEYICTI